MRSPVPAKSTVWSPTMSPPRSDAKPIAARVALAGGLAGVDRAGFRSRPARRRRPRPSAAPCRSARRSCAMVRLDDLDVEALGERARGDVEQLQHDVDADAHVRRHHDRDVLGMRRDLGLLRVARSRSCRRPAATPSSRQSGAGGPACLRRPREVDQHLRSRRAPARRSAVTTTPLGRPRNAAASWPIAGAAGDVERAGEHQVGARGDGLDQRPAHAARRAGDGDAQRPAARRAGRAAVMGRSARAAGRCARRPSADRLGRRRLRRRRQRLELLVGEGQRRRVCAGLVGVDRGDELALARQARRRPRCSSGRRPRSSTTTGAAAARRPGAGS